MEVKINKEIRDYTESVYFGLSLRQFIFSIAACLVAVLLYFVFKPYFGIETSKNCPGLTSPTYVIRNVYSVSVCFTISFILDKKGMSLSVLDRRKNY